MGDKSLPDLATHRAEKRLFTLCSNDNNDNMHIAGAKFNLDE